MQSLESLAPLPGPAPESQIARPDFNSAPSGTEAFDSIIRRTLAGPTAQSGSDSSRSEPKSFRTKPKSEKPSNQEASTQAASDAAHSMNVPAQAPARTDSADPRRESCVEHVQAVDGTKATLKSGASAPVGDTKSDSA